MVLRFRAISTGSACLVWVLVLIICFNFNRSRPRFKFCADLFYFALQHFFNTFIIKLSCYISIEGILQLAPPLYSQLAVGKDACILGNNSCQYPCDSCAQRKGLNAIIKNNNKLQTHNIIISNICAIDIVIIEYLVNRTH